MGFRLSASCNIVLPATCSKKEKKNFCWRLAWMKRLLLDTLLTRSHGSKYRVLPSLLPFAGTLYCCTHMSFLPYMCITYIFRTMSTGYAYFNIFSKLTWYLDEIPLFRMVYRWVCIMVSLAIYWKDICAGSSFTYHCHILWQHLHSGSTLVHSMIMISDR